MRKDVRRRHDAQVRTTRVCTEHSPIFDTTPGGQNARTELATRVDDNNRLLAIQQRSLEQRRAATSQLREARSALRTALKAVVSVGKRVHPSDAVMDTIRPPQGASDDE